MIAKPDRKVSAALRKRTKHKNQQTMSTTINNESTTAEPTPYNGQQPKPHGAKIDFNDQVFSLDYAVVKT